MAAEQNRVSAEEGALTSAARSAESAISSGINRVKGKVTEGVETSREYIREDPIKSVLISAGVGAVIGFLLGRNSNK